MITATHKGKYYDIEYSIVNVSELEGELRIDAEYYGPRYIELLSKIRSKNNDLFWTFVTKFEAGKNLSQCEKGIPYIRTQNVRQIIIEKEGLGQVSEEEELIRFIDEVIKENPKPVSDYKQGKKAALQFLIGQVMKKTRGKANPKIVSSLLERRLE